MMKPAMAKMLGFKQTTILSWDGPLPKPGEYLMSTNRPRFCYRVHEIEASAPGRASVAKAYLDRRPAAELPPDAVCHAWAWTKR